MVSVSVGEAFPRLANLGDIGGRLGRRAFVLFFYPAALTGG